MFCRKKSHIILFISFIFAGFCYSQTPAGNADIQQNSLAEDKPHTITLPNKKRIYTIVASDNEKELYLADAEGSVYSYDLETFRQNWSAVLGGLTSSNILEFGKYIYVVMSISENDSTSFYDRSVLWEIDKETGITANKINLPGAIHFYLFKSRDSFIVVSNTSEIKVFGKDSEPKPFGYFVKKELNFSPLFDSKTDELYMIYNDEVVKLLTAAEKEITVGKVWSANVPINAFEISDESYYIGDVSGNIYAVNRSNARKIWRFRAGGKISKIQSFSDKILVSSFDNFVYCLRASDGDIIWKKRFPGRVLWMSKLSADDLAVKSTYTDDLYVLDVLSGNIKDKYIVPENIGSKTDLTTTPRLIIIQNSYSIDIFQKN